MRCLARDFVFGNDPRSLRSMCIVDVHNAAYAECVLMRTTT